MMGVLVELIERLRLRIIVKRNKKIYSYNNWLWIYCHEIHDAFVSNTTMHPVNVPWEFLEHHTDYETE